MTWPGPAALGRGVVVADDQPVPAAWEGVAEETVDDGALAEPGPVVAALHGAWAGRRPVVVRLRCDPSRFRDAVDHDPDPLRAGTSFEPWFDRLHHLVWANTYDARAGDPVWWWSRKAVRLGAAEGGPADVLLADGTPAWLDGGPPSPLDPEALAGHAVVHRDDIEAGRLVLRPPPHPPHANLAPDQLAAVAHASGPARIVAPAGSGKTRVLTERVRHLVRERGYDAGSLLAVAFNVRAKKEMESRLGDVPGVRVQTLNGLGWWILREARGRDLRVLGERDVREVVGRLIEVRRQTNTDPLSPYLEGLSRIRLGLAQPSVVEAELDGEADGLADRVWPRFRDGLARAGGVDFDEQVFGAAEALLADGGLRRWAQERCRHLLVDEFQDLTPCHLLLIRLLTAPGLDVFGVGDDDQVLYGYMGATPRFLLDFDQWFPGGGAHPLEVNHRCPVAVTTAAATLLERNRVRVAKVIRAGPDADPDPGCLDIRRQGPEGAASEVHEVVRGWLDAGATPDQVAVLTRVNSLLLAPQVALRQAGVPVASELGEEVLRRTGMQAALAYLRLAADPGAMSGSDVAAILKRPSRGGLPRWLPERLQQRKGAWSVRSLRQLADTLQKDREKQNLLVVASDLERLGVAAKGGVRDTLTFVRDDIGLGQAMSLLDSSKGGQGGSNLDDIEALLQLADLHDEVPTFEDWLRGHLAEGAGDGDGVTLATVHRVKGQEWEHVVLFGVTDGICPHRLAEDVEEERRIVHVGITRGRQRVVVLGDAARPSPFLDELEGRDPPRRAPARPVVDPVVRRAPVPIALGDPAVSAALKAWRTQKATQEGKPAYIYLTDSLVEAIAAKKPATLFELRALPGIGPKKLDEYGEDLLAVVREASAAATPADG